ncbi:site-specific DNA-methyltransferase [Bifidobacterium sp. ESL0790]|uniref:site-specific DNA-methyltransferase n=1 Tax=Bifidobacterium sp. ESL0790 TaxID=2983233 RepID=UPI0023F9A9D6|nr:site-specific DNA-methyltransferase [Bifidobacterium sp. ESL0790]WEV71998.1 site-specific DNA-methyltransferase [Bifidobacterium sp. ESL0790]
MEVNKPMMDEIKTATTDITDENIQRIIELFPNTATEVRDEETGEVKKSIDFDVLREELGDVAEGTRERYQFTWPGKRTAKVEARTPISKTLRPIKECSKNWDTTKNLYIEGDNLDALKILRDTYAGKVKMIYIDPPYNTGNDRIYKDNFAKTAIENRADDGTYDESGGRLVSNLESNGRFHSDWCSMIYPRLLLARDMLTSDGTIFISIDDNEVNNCERICDEIFGRDNFVACFIWRKVDSPNDNHAVITPDHEYILLYCKNSSTAKLRQRYAPDLVKAYKGPDKQGRYWRDRLLRKNGKNSLRSDRPSMFYPLISPDQTEIWPIREDGREGCWSAGLDKVNELDNHGDLIWKQRSGTWIPYTREYAAENPTKPWMTIWNDLPAMRQTKSGMKELFKLSNVFDTPKPPALIERCMELAGVDRQDIVLDFFSGSAASAHATIELNAHDGNNRKFIMIQLPESCNNDSEAAQAGYSTICEIGEERIRRAGNQIVQQIEESNTQLELDASPKRVPDIGFRVFRIEDSNYKDVRVLPGQVEQGALTDFVDNVESDRSPMDLLFEVLPTFQIQYDADIKTMDEEEFDSFTVFNVNDGQLIACFDADLPEKVVRAIAELHPSYAVMSEKAFPNSAAKTNFAEIFKQCGVNGKPVTITKVL